jgi:UDP-glucose 4-epimerase
VAKALIGNRRIKTEITGIRPGEKIHEILVSEEEAWHTVEKGSFYAIKPLLPELREENIKKALDKEYSSKDALMSPEEITAMLEQYQLTVEHTLVENGEMLR